MNRKPAIIVLLLFCCLFGCNYGKKADNSIVESNFQETDDSPYIIKSPFNHVLMDEIHQSISDTNHLLQSQIYDLWFAKTDGDCCFAISTANFYHSRVAEGFYIIDNKLIVYYGTDVTCGAIMEGRIDPFINRENKDGCIVSCLIDTTLLLKECPTGFPDENSDEALYTQFDPYGKIFKVHNCDSLELIYTGFL